MHASALQISIVACLISESVSKLQPARRRSVDTGVCSYTYQM
ncbi:hypothetical protein BSU04_39875 [Caballeronia sordidicola]|uniref:Uncharacterized protein n=1 Tax=Caballeronia sordidicola TaxID=196367 RepID=A0A226WPQ4_CABSO|nr:hypothetical protein BSU04_39875 [Caballeronia sordidicola]